MFWEYNKFHVCVTSDKNSMTSAWESWKETTLPLGKLV